MSASPAPHLSIDPPAPPAGLPRWSRLSNKLLLTLLSAALLLPALVAPRGAGAATITAAPAVVGLGTTTVNLTLDPQGASASAWLVVLSGVGMSIDSIANVVPSGTDCSGLISAASFDDQCPNMPLNSSAVVAQVTVTATAIGGTLSLISGNITDFNITSNLTGGVSGGVNRGDNDCAGPGVGSSFCP